MEGEYKNALIDARVNASLSDESHNSSSQITADSKSKLTVTES